MAPIVEARELSKVFRVAKDRRGLIGAFRRPLFQRRPRG